MKNESTVTLPALPHESLRVLERAVAQRFNWRILIGDKTDQPRFVIEKQVRYHFARGFSTYALYQIIGDFQQSQNGETILHYVVSGQNAVPLFHAVFHGSILLVIAIIPGSFVSSPTTEGKLIGILLFSVLFALMFWYGRYAYRSYQGHLRELRRFMEEFAQGMGGSIHTS